MQKPNFFSRATKTTSALFVAGASLFMASCQEGFLEDIIKGDKKDQEEMDVRVFASTNTGSNFAIFDVSDAKKVDQTIASTHSMDADGIYYSQEDDIVYQLSRTESVVNAYSDIMDLMGDTRVSPAFSSTSDFTNGREIAVEGHTLVVAEDVDGMNQLVVYTLEDGAITLDRTYNVHIDLWGITLVDGTLYAVEDGTNNLAVFRDFGTHPEGNLPADQKVAIEGIVRTHGLSYDAENDVMVMTDIADAMNDTDGAFHVIADFSMKLEAAGHDGMIMVEDQIRVAGDNTYLGNPVDVAFSVDEKKVYVAERANAGGQLLIFDYPTENGNMMPVTQVMYEGASAVYLDEEK